jgi:hypothetical protein
VQGVFTASLQRHDVFITNAGTGWDDFNSVWCDALNAAERGEITHFAMLHSDISPDAGWLDVLLDELDRLDADLVSVPSPIKDVRGLTSSGIGNPDNRWSPLRRFTVRELERFPETFDAGDVGYAGLPLLHNTGCWACDLRRPSFFQEDDGNLVAFFDFPRRVYRAENGSWVNACESEDWYFSRMLHNLGASTFITRKVKLCHRGVMDFPNHGNWGTYLAGDENTKALWRKES